MYSISEIINSFKTAMDNNGLSTNTPIIPDGKIQRFHVSGDKPNSENGWYILFLNQNQTPCGKFGSWKTNTPIIWSAKSHSQMSPHEWVNHCKLMKEAQHKQQIARMENQKNAAIRANEIWNTSEPASPKHLYLQHKQIPAFTAHQSGNALVLPICDIQGQLWSLQFIYPNGRKILLPGGAKKGNFIAINGTLSASRILICEGFATGATLALTNTSDCVIAAIDAGNLQSVALSIRQRYPNATIVICADDDRLTPSNPGATSGKHAAIASKGTLALPQWPIGAPETLTDFNDLFCWLNSKEKLK
jgi:putative DNA primase/helicase